MLLHLSCDSEVQIGNAKSAIDLTAIEETPQLLSIRELMRNVEYLRLNSSDEYYLADASKIKPLKNKYIIYDKIKMSLTAWSKQGDFLSHVGNKGFGPGEYKSVTDFDIHPKRNSIFVFSRGDKSILEYDSGLKFKKRFRVEPWALYMSVLSNGNIALYSYFDNPEMNIVIYDPESGNVLDERMAYPNSLKPELVDYSGFIRGDYYTYPFSNKVYKVGDLGDPIDSIYFEIKIPDQRDPELKFDHAGYLSHTNKENNEILRDFTVGYNGTEILFYYGYRTRGRTGMTIGVMNRSGQVYGHVNLKHGGRDKSEPFNRLFFLNPYNVPRYSTADHFYYLPINQSGMTNVFGEGREEFLKGIKEVDVNLFNELQQMEQGDNPIIMKFRLRSQYAQMIER